MNIYEFVPIRMLIEAASWAVTGLTDLLAPLAGQTSAALAVILLTLLVRVLLIPVGYSQVRAGIARERLAPKIRELQQRYGKNPELMQRKLMELYRDEKASPLAGCLPVLAQTPVLMGVYGLFVVPTIGGEPNGLLAHSLLGTPLGSSLVGGLADGAGWGTVALFLAIMAVIAVVAQASRRVLMPQTPQAPPVAEGRPGAPDLSGVMRAMSFMPFLTAVIAAFVPLAAALYLMTTTSWTLLERVVLRRLLRSSEAA